MDETPPTPKATEEIKPAPAPAKPQPLQGPQFEYEPYLFYHVMPRAGGRANLVKPTLAVAKEVAIVAEDKPKKTPGVKTTSELNTLTPKKVLIALGVGVVMFGGLGYFVWNKFSTGQPRVDVNALARQLTSQSQHLATTTPTTATQVSTSPAWQQKYFGSSTCTQATVCGDSADPDRDGLTNLQEFKAGTDPNHADSDNDGLSDGDEVNVFLSDPLNSHSSGNSQYSDGDNAKAGYNLTTGKKLSSDELQALEKRMQQYKLTEPTIKTIGTDVLMNLYNFTPPSQPGSPATPTSTPSSTPPSLPATTDQSANAKQLRDAQRTATMQNLAIALIKYKNANKTFPATSDFSAMVSAVQPYNPVATDTTDPINRPPYVYGYSPLSGNTDFTLSFFSETQNLLIKLHAADAQKMFTDQQAQQNDEQRKTDLESLQSALLLYSNDHVTNSQTYIFPSKQKYTTALVPKYVPSIPKDPLNGKAYDYEPASDLSNYTLKAVLQNPPTGSTGYSCDREGCDYY